ncbi:uncharacterized protein LOC116140726 [Pistacia vera]|uniref:uncharacterized protein LOC116140726 n=1 Tax=Pistacia vera TaxID=55513 RepID=UPI001263521A|nr:uncharacterized protein LOC116140726 [Pistacia vera]
MTENPDNVNPGLEARLQVLTSLMQQNSDKVAALKAENNATRTENASIRAENQSLKEKRRGEPLREYVSRFNREKISIPSCNPKTAVDAFRKGFLPDGELYKELTKLGCTTMEDALARAVIQIRWEEDDMNRAAHSKYESRRSDKKPEFKPVEHHYQPLARNMGRVRKPYDRQHARNDNRQFGSNQHKILGYNLNVEPTQVVAIMKGLGSTVKWPGKLNPEARRDTTKWYEFHSDHRHNTGDSIALQLEVAAFLKRGHLRDMLTDKGKNTISQKSSKEPSLPPREPTPKGLCSLISRGSGISGVIQFEDDEPITLAAPHHDALVVSLQIANILVKRVFVDGGSSANILFLEAVKAMGLEEANINRRPTLLVGFSLEQKYFVGEIILPIYAGGINKQTVFLVIDCPSPYNVILDRPWIHDMRAVPSTFHQTIRFLTKWGVREIKGDPKAYRDCYKNAFKDTSGRLGEKDTYRLPPRTRDKREADRISQTERRLLCLVPRRHDQNQSRCNGPPAQGRSGSPTSQAEDEEIRT